MDKSDNKDQSKSQTAKTTKRYPCGTTVCFCRDCFGCAWAEIDYDD